MRIGALPMPLRWLQEPRRRVPDEGEPSVGFLAQSPTGKGCAVAFERISFRAEHLDDLRSGV